MRIWHPIFYPYLCRKHLLAVWNEANICYKGIVNGGNGWRNHPEYKMFVGSPETLHNYLTAIRLEMVSRGYNVMALPKRVVFGGEVHTYKDIAQQYCDLVAKGCECNIAGLKDAIDEQ